MKKLLLILIGLALLAYGCKDDPDTERPPVDPPEETVDEVRNLELLCRVWGLAKYYHPVFATDSKVDLDADKELLTLIPEAFEQTFTEFNGTIAEWIESFGEFNVSEESWRQYLSNLESENEGIYSIISTEWAESENLSEELRTSLYNVRYSLRESHSKYILPDYDVSIFSQINENPIPDADVSDVGVRLLALFRYWNVTEYLFPGKYLTDTPWDDVLKKHIPKFIKADTDVEYRKAVARLTVEICDTHGALCDLLPVKGNYMYPYLIGQFAEGKFTAAYGLSYGNSKVAMGDEILSVDGRTPAQFISTAKEYLPLGNEGSLYREAGMLANYTNNPSMEITLKNSRGNEYTITVSNTQLNENPSPIQAGTGGGAKVNNVELEPSIYDKGYGMVVGENLGYVHKPYYSSDWDAEMMEYFKDTKAIIFDMRSSSANSSHIFHLAYQYFDPASRDFTLYGQPAVMVPGIFYTYRLNTWNYTWDGVNKGTYSGKIAILVDSNTQSSLEFQTMVMQSLPNTIVVGSQTAGADGNTSFYSLPGGLEVCFSGHAVRYPDGTETQRAGVKIDYPVELTIQGIREGRDEILEKAVELLR